MKNRCANYDKEIECCRILSDWSETMPALQPCVESPCKYFKPYTNYDRIKSISVDEMTSVILMLSERVKKYPNARIKLVKQWLLQEASEDE